MWLGAAVRAVLVSARPSDSLVMTESGLHRLREIGWQRLPWLPSVPNTDSGLSVGTRTAECHLGCDRHDLPTAACAIKDATRIEVRVRTANLRPRGRNLTVHQGRG